MDTLHITHLLPDVFDLPILFISCPVSENEKLSCSPLLELGRLNAVGPDKTAGRMSGVLHEKYYFLNPVLSS